MSFYDFIIEYTNFKEKSSCYVLNNIAFWYFIVLFICFSIKHDDRYIEIVLVGKRISYHDENLFPVLGCNQCAQSGSKWGKWCWFDEPFGDSLNAFLCILHFQISFLIIIVCTINFSNSLMKITTVYHFCYSKTIWDLMKIETDVKRQKLSPLKSLIIQSCFILTFKC